MGTKTAGSYPMTPIEDHLARALSLGGKSFREIGALLGRSDKSISSAVERAIDGDHPLLKMMNNDALKDALGTEDRQLLNNVEGFSAWLEDGEERGYVAALVGLLK